MGALVLGAVILGQLPSAWQIAGSALMLLAAYAGTRRTGDGDPGRTEPGGRVSPGGWSPDGRGRSLRGQ
ncbi:hypothetical protein [Nocardia aurantia]|uniref:hypothetical protein n=1 Tax=Nocardia aurantia TaxID=2585199 RepID=UPI001D0F9FF6|nr:hypothetical protein [Nocardia aurantia]